MQTIQQKLATAEIIIKEFKVLRTIQKAHYKAIWEKDFIRADDILVKVRAQSDKVDKLLTEY